MTLGPAESQGDPDGALTALATLLALHQVVADPARMRHELGHADPASADDLLRLARRFDGVRARAVAARWSDLASLPLPALAHGPNGWFLIGRVRDGEALIQPPGAPVATVDADALAQRWSGQLVLLTTRESVHGHAGRFDVSWFIPQIVRYRRPLAEVLLVTFAINLLGLAAPLFFQNVVDKVLVHNVMATLNVLAVGYVAVSVWETLFGWARTKVFSETCQKIDVELGAKLYRHLLSLPLAYFETRRVGDTATRVRQVETIREFLTNASLTVIVDPPFTVVFLVAMWFYSPTLLWIVLLTLPAYVLVSAIVTGPMRARLDEKFERGSANNALLVESIGGVQTIKAGAVEPQWLNRWERQLAGYCAAGQNVIDLGNGGSQAIQLISKLSMAAILYFGAKAVIAGELTIGGLIAFNMFAQRVSGPVIRMAQLWQEFQQVRIAIDRLGDVLNQPLEPGLGSQVALPSLAGKVRFVDVSFRYALDGPWTLHDINLTVPAGSSLGIVGSSGSGKSTLTKLLQRLYAPASGKVLIDDVDIGQVDPLWLRRNIGVVLQENLLFNRTIRENIALADPAMPMERVIEAAELAGAHAFVTALPHGYDTPIEERGTNLSGGQRQRLAIARALVTRPRILILDEATSALDAESESVIQANLDRIAQGRTVIIIAHRLSAVRRCRRIIALEAGEIVEAGSHDELIATGGRYAQLHRQQMGLVQGLAA